MKVLIKKMVGLVLGMGFMASGYAHATFDVWDTPAPWAAATPTYYVGWNAFDNASFDNTPDVAGSGTGSFTVIAPNSFIYANSNISVPNPSTQLSPLFSGAISSMDATTGLFYDVYVRVESYKTQPLTSATLYYTPPNAQTSFGVTGTSISTFTNPNTLEQEFYWLFSGISASATYTINITNAGSTDNNYQLMQFEVAVLAPAVATPVSENEIYSMMAVGLGLIGFISRGRAKKAIAV